MTFVDIAKKYSDGLEKLSVLRSIHPAAYQFCVKEAKVFVASEFAIDLDKVSEIIVTRKKDFDYHGAEQNIVDHFLKRLSFNVVIKAYSK